MTILIKLDKAVESFGKPIEEITLNEPTGGLYARLGEPRIGVYNEKTGHGYYIEQHDVISKYLDHLIDVGDASANASVLATMSLVDMKRLKDALFSFFDGAAVKAAKLKWSSSSTE